MYFQKGLQRHGPMAWIGIATTVAITLVLLSFGPAVIPEFFMVGKDSSNNLKGQLTGLTKTRIPCRQEQHSLTTRLLQGFRQNILEIFSRAIICNDQGSMHEDKV